jgi:hypothetical protein
MAETQARVRPDVDILEDLHTVIAHYPPLAADRHHVRVAVVAGEVVLEGHVMTPITRHYLIEHAATISGVRAVRANALYDDETIRLELGAGLPEGVFANPDHGVVILSGELPGGAIAADVVQRAAAVPGVVRVVTTFQTA